MRNVGNISNCMQMCYFEGMTPMLIYNSSILVTMSLLSAGLHIYDIWNVWSNIRATFPHRMQPLRVDSKDWMWLANQNCTAIDANIYKPVTNICKQITKTKAIFSGQSYHYFTNRVRIWSAPHSHQLCLFVCLPMFFFIKVTFPLPLAVDALIV